LRIALFSDVHGNGVAFRAMLDDLGGQQVDTGVCLGDHAQGGPEPAQTLELLRELGWPAVMGNSDHFLLSFDFGEEAVTEAQIENAKWSQSQLPDDLLEFHQSFPPTVEVDLEGRMLLAFHATPRSREEIVGPWMEEEEFREPFDGLSATVFAGGHTHQQWARRLGDAYYINPGSVGLPVDHLQSGPTRAEVAAEYAILTVDGPGIGVEFRRVPFDADEVIRSVEESGMPNPEIAAGPWRHL
jgi:predicted phosphodiesterase